MSLVRSYLRPFLFLASALCIAAPAAGARDLRITIPRRGIVTPVQRLNREGVKEVRKHHYEKAEALFYKAYLYDPADPFTLNNLGYISELEGHLQRAQKFYQLAEKQGSSAVIDMSSAKQLQGQPMTAAIRGLKNQPMRVNHLNVEAIQMLSRHHPFEAESVLRQALKIDPSNPFTLNNLAVAEESTGDLPSALKHYRAAAASRSQKIIVVTYKTKVRGQPISKVATENLQALKTVMANMTPDEEQAMLLTLQGVSALNQNHWSIARKDFLKAYFLAPADAFALNNRGYVAERENHLESAQFYYAKARRAQNAGMRVGWSTSPGASGKNINFVARDNNDQVNNALNAYSRQRKTLHGPIKLIPRHNGVVQPAPSSNSSPNSSKPQQSSSQPSSSQSIQQ